MEKRRGPVYLAPMADLFPRYRRIAAVRHVEHLADALDRLSQLETEMLGLVDQIVARLVSVVSTADAKACGEQMTEALSEATWSERKRLKCELDKAERHAGDEL